MLKRLIFALSLLSTPLAAEASQDLALEWGQKAAALRADTTEYIDAIDYGYEPVIGDDYLTEIERFAVNAGRLGRWLNSTGGAGDLSCVVSKLAIESERELSSLLNAPDSSSQRLALVHVSDMLSQAEYIAVVSARRSDNTATLSLSTASTDCSARRGNIGYAYK